MAGTSDGASKTRREKRRRAARSHASTHLSLQERGEEAPEDGREALGLQRPAPVHRPVDGREEPFDEEGERAAPLRGDDASARRATVRGGSVARCAERRPRPPSRRRRRRRTRDRPPQAGDSPRRNPSAREGGSRTRRRPSRAARRRRSSPACGSTGRWLARHGVRTAGGGLGTTATGRHCIHVC